MVFQTYGNGLPFWSKYNSLLINTETSTPFTYTFFLAAAVAAAEMVVPVWVGQL
jgi:hypothetical protein